jgi:hypothetical protein
VRNSEHLGPLELSLDVLKEQPRAPGNIVGRFSTWDFVELCVLFTPLCIRQAFADAETALEQKWLNVYLLDSKELGNNLSALLGPA